jgi:hypothetical protein
VRVAHSAVARAATADGMGLGMRLGMGYGIGLVIHIHIQAAVVDQVVQAAVLDDRADVITEVALSSSFADCEVVRERPGG